MVPPNLWYYYIKSTENVNHYFIDKCINTCAKTNPILKNVIAMANRFIVLYSSLVG